jgi:acetyltransferase
VRQDGEEMRIRPIRAEDEPKMVRFHGTLSEDSVYLRYASLLKLSQRVAHERLARICFIDYERQIALVAERRDPGSDDSRIIAVARLTKVYGTNDAEFALLVSDAYQRRGIGTDMLRQLIEIGRDEGLDRITADILLQNTGMQHVCRKLGFELVRNADPDDPMMKAVKRL